MSNVDNYIFLHFSGEKLRSSDSNKLIRSILIVCHKCIDISNKKIDASHSNDILYECFRLLRNACAGGQNIQNQIVDFKEESINTFEIIKSVLFEHVLNNKIQKICWQFVANLSVGNAYSQRTIRNECIEQILNKFNCVCDSGNQRECTMILYNHCIGQCNTRNDTKRIIEFLLECAYNRNAIDHGLDSNDFYRIFMDNFITNYADVVPVYDKIESSEKRLYLLYYIADHLKDIKHEVISSKLLQFICKDFKKKYDCVLKTLNSVHLKEVMTILELIARASSDERYSQYLNFDSNLFLNVGELLRQIVEIGKREPTTDQPNIFAPIRNLEQLAPNFEGDLTIERDISYGLKSTLIRIIANLAYKNKINQELVNDFRNRIE